MTPRLAHKKVARLVLPFLALSALTGLVYRVGRVWFGWTTEQAQWLLDVHQGTLLFGRDYRAYYVIVIGLGLLGLVVTGATMLGWIRTTPRSSSARG